MNADPPDSPHDDPDQDSGHGLDVDAAFAEIVRHFGDPPSAAHDAQDAAPSADDPACQETAPDADASPESSAEEPGTEQPAGPTAAPAPQPQDPGSLRDLFTPAWSDPIQSEASWADEGHFIPPPPPPLPFVEPRRLLAWIGLFGGPTLALIAIVLGIPLSRLVGFALTCGFVGGFVYLVATMAPTREDGSGGDDGAVL